MPARTKAFLVDGATSAVVWMNEAARHDLLSGGPSLPAPLAEALPVAETLGIPSALAEVAATGEPRHLTASLVSTSHGSVEIVASVHRLPDGMLLLLVENAWQPRHDRRDPSSRSRRTR